MIKWCKRPVGRKGVGVLVALLSLSSVSANAAFEAPQVFEKKCSSCHTIGNGILKGPDLKDVTKKRKEEWLIRFIQSSADMIESGDADAVKIYNEFGQKDMPDQRLSPDEIRQILKFIESGGAVATSVNIKSALEAKPEDILAGKELFLGLRPLSNGGPACLSCHSAGNHGPMGGGTLGKNLTTVYSTYNDQGLSVALKKSAFPVMTEIFGERPLSDGEIFQLKAFLYHVDKEGMKKDGSQKKFLFLGLGGAALMLGLIDFAWRRRRKTSVRRSHGGIR